MYYDPQSQIQSLQNQIAQLSQLYQNTAVPAVGTAQIPAASARQVQNVQGWRGAEDYRLNPGESIFLNDSDSPVIYFKVCDANGVTKLRALQWEDVTERYTNPAPSGDYVTKSEFNDFKSELKSIIDEYAKDLTEKEKSE
jgi:hypothetical protein